MNYQNTINDILILLTHFREASNIQEKLNLIAEGIAKTGWGRVHIYFFNSETQEVRSAAYYGLTDEEIKFLMKKRMSFNQIQTLISPRYDKFRIGRSYFFPYPSGDKWIEELRGTALRSHHSQDNFGSWHTKDMLYFPVRGFGERVLGLVSVDDPASGERPTEESLRPVELFIDYVVSLIEEEEFRHYFAKSRDFLSRLFDESPAAIVITDEHGVIMNANPAALGMFGYSRAQLIGLSEKSLFSSEENYKKMLSQREQKGKFGDESVLLRKNNEGFWGYLVSSTVKTPENITEGYFLMIIDITEQKNLQQYLIRAEKMAGIGVLASGIAHELNNPLYGILGLAEAMMEEKDIPTIHEYASDIVQYSKEAAAIVRDLSGYSHSAKQEAMSTVNINDAAKQALKMLERLDKLSNVDVVTDFAELPEISASGGELQQIFMNLVTNAIDSMKNSDQRVLSIKTRMLGENVEIKVSDSGVGISDENIQYIFEPFYTTKELGEGTGLGLYITYRIVTKYQGKIDVQSETGKGTTFTIILPLQRE